MSRRIIEAPPSEILNFEIEQMIEEADREMQKVEEETLRKPDGKLSTRAIYKKNGAAPVVRTVRDMNEFFDPVASLKKRAAALGFKVTLHFDLFLIEFVADECDVLFDGTELTTFGEAEQFITCCEDCLNHLTKMTYEAGRASRNT